MYGFPFAYTSSCLILWNSYTINGHIAGKLINTFTPPTINTQGSSDGVVKLHSQSNVFRGG